MKRLKLKYHTKNLTLGDSYTVIKEDGKRVMVMNDLGNWQWFKIWRFEGV